ncbi:MAG TPA: hypothetical protein EYH10_05415 [Deltaproteobacteria bacterium]|nr:hypothetical protein [Deltaproteobacteria bacterium]
MKQLPQFRRSDLGYIGSIWKAKNRTIASLCEDFIFLLGALEGIFTSVLQGGSYATLRFASLNILSLFRLLP